MKTIIAGSRSITSMHELEEVIKDSLFTITEVVSAGDIGVDRLGETWAEEHGVPIKKFHPDFDMYKDSAPKKTNIEMVAYADAVLVLWDGKSQTTEQLLLEAHRAELPTKCRIVKD